MLLVKAIGREGIEEIYINPLSVECVRVIEGSLLLVLVGGTRIEVLKETKDAMRELISSVDSALVDILSPKKKKKKGGLCLR